MTKRTAQDIRNNPDRKRWLVRQAAAKTGLPFKIYETLAPESKTYFDIIFTLRDGSRAAVHMYTRRDHAPSCPTNMMAREMRLQAIAAYKMPYLEIWPGPIDAMWAHMEYWLSNIKTQPVKLAPRLSPFHKIPRLVNKDKFGMPRH